MQVSDRVEATVAAISFIGLLFCGVAWLMVPTGDFTKVRHLAVFLAMNAYVEIGFVFCGAVFLWLARRCNWFDLYRLPAKGAFSAFVNRVLWSALIVFSFSAALLCVKVVRARVFFWQHLAIRAYVHDYARRIDVLVKCNRIKDAAALTSILRENVGGTSYEARLDGPLLELKRMLQRSDHLVDSRTVHWVGRWNPISDARAYFEVAEALRSNPQNYRAASVLAQMVARIEQETAEDARDFCAGTWKGSAFKVRTAALLDFESMWQDGGWTPAAALKVLGDRWKLREVHCLLAISAATEGPVPERFDSRRDTAALQSCSGLELSDEWIW